MQELLWQAALYAVLSIHWEVLHEPYFPRPLHGPNNNFACCIRILNNESTHRIFDPLLHLSKQGFGPDHVEQVEQNTRGVGQPRASNLHHGGVPTYICRQTLPIRLFDVNRVADSSIDIARGRSGRLSPNDDSISLWIPKRSLYELQDTVRIKRA